MCKRRDVRAQTAKTPRPCMAGDRCADRTRQTPRSRAYPASPIDRVLETGLSIIARAIRTRVLPASLRRVPPPSPPLVSPPEPDPHRSLPVIYYLPPGSHLSYTPTPERHISKASEPSNLRQKAAHER